MVLNLQVEAEVEVEKFPSYELSEKLIVNSKKLD